MRLLKRKSRTFEIQVQEMTLHIQAATDVDEESRAAALSFWEVLHSYSIRNPDFRASKRPVTVPDLYASFWHAFGVDPWKEYSANDRPIFLTPKDGRVVRELMRDEATPEKIVTAATGGH